MLQNFKKWNIFFFQKAGCCENDEKIDELKDINKDINKQTFIGRMHIICIYSINSL